MATLVYSVCAVIGGTVLVCQFIMTVLGLDHADVPDDAPHEFGHDFDHDVGVGHDADGADGDHAHNSSWFFGMLTFRTIIAALTFFGLAGLAGGSAEMPALLTLLVALGAGWAAMFGVHWMMQVLYRLRSDGTVRIRRAMGQQGTVYLRVPAENAGVGKVHVNVQNRTMEYDAMTSQAELPVGARIVVVDVVGPDTVQVELVHEPQRSAHA